MTRFITAQTELFLALNDMAMAFGNPDDPDVQAWWQELAEDLGEDEVIDQAFHRNEARARARKALERAAAEFAPVCLDIPPIAATEH